jgi:hypothetical protein
MPVRRLGAGHDLTCERAYSGYEIANMPVQDAGKDRKVQFEYSIKFNLIFQICYNSLNLIDIYSTSCILQNMFGRRTK